MKDRKPSCTKCGNKGIRSEKFDAYYCPQCLVWLEDTCYGDDCCFCPGRPDKPEKDQR